MSAFTTKYINANMLPLVLEPTDKNMSKQAFSQLIHDHKQELHRHLLKSGGLLFRGFPLHDENDFAALIKGLDTGKFIDYVGGDSPRNKIKEGIYTSTEAPPSLKIPLHNELSFVKHYPKHIYFYCHTPPKTRGETTIADARKVYNAISSDTRQRFIEKSLKYVSCYYHKSTLMNLLNRLQRSHKSWVDVFETHDKQAVEQKCHANEFAFQWQQNDWLQISQTRPAAMPHPATGEMTWFNQAHLYDFNPKLLGWPRYISAKDLQAMLSHSQGL